MSTITKLKEINDTGGINMEELRVRFVRAKTKLTFGPWMVKYLMREKNCTRHIAKQIVKYYEN